MVIIKLIFHYDSFTLQKFFKKIDSFGFKNFQLFKYHIKLRNMGPRHKPKKLF